MGERSRGQGVEKGEWSRGQGVKGRWFRGQGFEKGEGEAIAIFRMLKIVFMNQSKTDNNYRSNILAVFG